MKNVWRITENTNFVKNIDPKTGELIGRRDFTAGKVITSRCARTFPAASAGTRGSYNPKTGLYYKLGQEWCMTLDVQKTTPVVAPQVQLNIGADFKIAPPPGGEIYGHLDARDPVTGAKKWEVRFPEPPLASVLSTGGNLVFVPDSRGIIHAYDAEYRHRAVESLRRHRPSGRHRQLLRRRQAIYRRDRGLWRHGVGRLRANLRRRLTRACRATTVR